MCCSVCGTKFNSTEETLESAMQQKAEFEKLSAKMAQIESINGKILEFLQVVKKKDSKLYGEFETIVAKV